MSLKPDNIWLSDLKQMKLKKKILIAVDGMPSQNPQTFFRGQVTFWPHPKVK